MSLRLEETPFEFEGKAYILRCNMAVLETVQDNYGSFEAAMTAPVRESSIYFLTAMLNDYADEQGWEERWTFKQVQRRVTAAMVADADIVGMVTRAVTPTRTVATEENSGN